jgi:hypothetical protein
MKLKGKIEVSKGDILMYKGIYDLATNKIQKIDGELIPTFIIEESLTYFCDLEKYEFCQKIKSFFKENPTFTTPSTREDWFGINPKKKQKY